MKLVRKYEKQLHKSGSSNIPPAIMYDDKPNASETNPLVPFGDVASSSYMEYDLKLESLVEVLTKQLQRGRVETKLAVLRWIYHLFNICRPKVRYSFVLTYLKVKSSLLFL